MQLLGIEIGGTKLQLVLGLPTGEITARRRLAVDRTAGAAGIRDQIERTVSELRAQANPAAIGIGFGGPVDWRTGRICVSHHVAGWSEFDLAGWLRERTGLPVAVENDSNLAALGEATCGAGVGAEPMFYFNLGSGVGGGLVTQGRVYHGITPGEVEFGHVRLDRSGATVESRCSGWAVDARIRQLRTAAPESLLARLTAGTEDGEARHLATALAQGDATAASLLNEVATDLAFALSHVVHLFHPQVLVMGGGLSLLGEPLRAAVAMALPGFVMEAFHPPPPVRLAELGESAVPVGALLLAGSVATAC